MSSFIAPLTGPLSPPAWLANAHHPDSFQPAFTSSSFQHHTRTASSSSSNTPSGGRSYAAGRQTRISDHLKTVKTATPSPSTKSNKRAGSHQRTASSLSQAQPTPVGRLSPRRMARFEGQRPVTPPRRSSAASSTSRAGQDQLALSVKKMRDEEVAYRLLGEKEELMGRLAQHG